MFLLFYFIICCCLCVFVFFFFFSSRRRHTRCLSDWSSDVCSSDLSTCRAAIGQAVTPRWRVAVGPDGSGRATCVRGLATGLPPADQVRAKGAGSSADRGGKVVSIRELAVEPGKGGIGMLTVEVLGPLRVSVAGLPVELPAGRLRALLAVLAMSAGHTVPADRLAAAVWGADLRGDPRANVRTNIKRLRRALGTTAGQLIEARPGGYL